jgi:hypothetical protein
MTGQAAGGDRSKVWREAAAWQPLEPQTDPRGLFPKSEVVGR